MHKLANGEIDPEWLWNEAGKVLKAREMVGMTPQQVILALIRKISVRDTLMLNIEREIDRVRNTQ